MRPRIVILSAFLSPLRSGAEACVEEVPPFLRDRYDFIILTARMKRELPRKDNLPCGIPVRRLGLGFSVDKYLFPFLAAQAVKKLRPTIVHAVLESFAGLAMVLCRWTVPEAKRLLTLQSTNTKMFLKTMHQFAHRLTAISSVLLERARRFGRNDVPVITNGISLRAIQEACARYGKVPNRVLFVGRLEQMKGVDTLLDAFALLRQRDDVRLHVVGDGSQRSMLMQKAREQHLPVSFTGTLRGPALYREYAEAEIFCGLSRSEALGNVFLEAQAAGCAVIGTTVGGIPEIVRNGQTGVLVPPDDPVAAASALRSMISDSRSRQIFQQAGAEAVPNFDWSVIAERYANVYNTLLR